MSSRFHVDANLIATPFSTAANTYAARNEERRLERIYGGAPQPRQDGMARMMAGAQAYRDDMKVEVQRRAAFGTSGSTSRTSFGGKLYALPPIRQQDYLEVHRFGDTDQHFGGLGLTSQMVRWKSESSGRISDHYMKADAYNAKVLKKAKGGLFKKKTAPPELVKVVLAEEFVAIFNRKLAEARVAARVELVDGEEFLTHPSSESGNPEAEMRAWAAAHWQGIPERPWQDTMIALPPVPEFK